MKAYNPNVGLSALCRLFGKSRQGYYELVNRRNDKQLHAGVIVEATKALKATTSPNWSPAKMLEVLKPKFDRIGVSIGRDRYRNLLREHNLLAPRRKRHHVVTTNSNHPYKIYKDLTKGLILTGPEQLWVSDITYVRTRRRQLYLSLIMDAYSRKVVGYHLSQSLQAAGSLIALEKAIRSVSTTTKGIIHHSDRGIQYACDAYTTRLKDAGIAISMARKGNPYDNALAERMNQTLKYEFGFKEVFKSYNDALQPLSRSIAIYNRIRPHMSIDMLTPQQAHRKAGPLKKRWKTKTYKPCQTPKPSTKISNIENHVK